MNTNNWKLDLFSALDTAHSIKAIMNTSLEAVRPLGFDFCGWRTQSIPPVIRGNEVIAFNAVEDAALEHITQGVYDQAPVPQHCMTSSLPIAWQGTTKGDLFLQSPTLWEEYYSTGHRAGWAISTQAHEGSKGIFFVESKNILSPQELCQAEQHMLWVSAAAYIKIDELKEATHLKISPDEKIILELLYQYNASLKLMLLNSDMNLAYVVNIIKNLRKKFDCIGLHSLVVQALFLGIIN